MKPTKGRSANFQGRLLSVQWNMQTLFLFANDENAKIGETEQTINEALIAVHGANGMNDVPMKHIKTICAMVEACTKIPQEQVFTEFQNPDYEELITATVGAYSDQIASKMVKGESKKKRLSALEDYGNGLRNGLDTFGILAKQYGGVSLLVGRL